MAIQRLMATASDLEKDLSGRVYLVTGANSGVGLATTKQLLSQGAHVILASRNVAKAEAAISDFSGVKGSTEIVECDLSSLDSVREATRTITAQHKVLDGLIGNAGGVMPNGSSAVITDDGIEETFQSNFLGHFLLFESLLPLVRKSMDGRVLILSSVVHAGGLGQSGFPALHLDDLNYSKRKYSSFEAYGEAKLASVLYAKELAAREKDNDIFVASIHPGWARSNFGRGAFGAAEILLRILQPLTARWSDSNEEAAQTTLHCLLSDEVKPHSGSYFSQHSVLYRDSADKKGGWPMKSPNPNAHDLEMAVKLVVKARELTAP